MDVSSDHLGHTSFDTEAGDMNATHNTRIEGNAHPELDEHQHDMANYAADEQIQNDEEDAGMLG